MYHCKPTLGSSNCTLRLEYNWYDFKVCCSNQSTLERMENKQIIKKVTHKKKKSSNKKERKKKEKRKEKEI